jgi:hypothetical protein
VSAATTTAYRSLNPRRILVLARHTFTQLVRMKVFYFLAVFAVVVIGANFLELPTDHLPENAGTEILYTVKNTSLGCMSIFSLVLAIVATGLLLPKDVEDRTLYTILAKPVPRLDYLIGKWLGVVALIFVSLMAMTLLMNLVLIPHTSKVMQLQIGAAEFAGANAETKAKIAEDVRALGPTWNLQAAVLVTFMRAMVLAAVALLLSTFSTSTLFTAIVGFLVLFIGFFQADAREIYFGQDSGLAGKAASGIMTVILPDLQVYNLIDAIVEGKVIQAFDLLKVIGITAFYCVTYLFASWLVFARKEF